MLLARFDIGSSLQTALTGLLAFLPKLIGFLVILIVGYVIARIVKAIIVKVLDRFHLDRRLHESPAGNYVEKFSPGASPSRLVGGVSFWLIFIFALTAAIGALQIPAVTAFMNQVLIYLPNVIVAVLIFVIAAAIAGAVAGLVERTMGDTPTGDLVKTAVPALVLSVAFFMILTQLRIAPSIVQILFTAIVGALALGLALAFGLGGRNVAARILEEAYQRGQDQRDQARRDVETGKQRGRRDVEQARTEVEGTRPPGGNLPSEDPTRVGPTPDVGPSPGVGGRPGVGGEPGVGGGPSIGEEPGGSGQPGAGGGSTPARERGIGPERFEPGR
jgi:mechanosensitive ion channel-like protein